MRIASVIDRFHPARGGAERVALELAKALVRRGHEVATFTILHDRALPLAEEVEGMKIRRVEERLPPPPVRTLFYERIVSKRLCEVVAAERWDAILIHPLAAGWEVSKLAPPKLAFFYAPFHQELGLERRGPLAWWQGLLRRSYQRRILERVEMIAILSDCSGEWLRAFAPACVWKARKIPPGVDAKRFTPGDRTASRARFGLGGQFVVATARRLVPRMGLEEIVRAAGLLKASGLELQVRIAGEGPLRLCLEGELERAGFDRSCLLGPVTDEALVDLYRAADLIVMPSLALEAFGLVALEALACGTPALVARCTGAAEVVGTICPDLVLELAEPAEIARKVRLFAEKYHGDLGLRAECRRVVETSFTWDAMAERVQEAIGRPSS